MIISKKNQLIGLDIGSYSIKLVEIEHKKKEKLLKNIGIAYIPPESISAGEIKDPYPIKQAIIELFNNLKVKNKKVAVSVSGISVIAKKISLVDREDLDLEDAIKHEAEQFIPYDMDEVNLDFDIMSTIYDETSSEDMGRLEIMVVAAKKSLIDAYVDLLQDIGLSPSIMDVDIFAMQNTFEMSALNISHDKCYILVDIGATTLNTNVIKGDVSLFVRSSSLGGMQITKQIMEEFQIDFIDAEKIKLGAMKFEKAQDVKIRKIFRDVINEWINEIKGNIDFINRTYPGENIEKIIITGGSSRIKGLKELLSSEIGIAVEELNPFSNLHIDKKIDPSYLEYISFEFAIAVGLSLRSIGDK